MIDYGTFEKKKTYGNQNNFLKLFLVGSRCLALPQRTSIQQTLGALYWCVLKENSGRAIFWCERRITGGWRRGGGGGRTEPHYSLFDSDCLYL